MRQLTTDEKEVLQSINVNHIDYDNIEGFIEAGFIAGIEYQDKRIEAFLEDLRYCHSIDEVLDKLDEFRL